MSAVYGNETLKPAFSHGPVPNISYGIPFPEACSKHVRETFKASRVYLIVSKSLCANTDAVNSLRGALGNKVVGIRVGMKPHTYWSEVLEIIEDARPLSIDCIITVGAGSLTDAAKVIAWALANNVRTWDDLDSLAFSNVAERTEINDPIIPMIAVPTSLSGGEYSSIAGATNDKTKVKTLFAPPKKNPALVVLDPDVTATTPEHIWLSTGVRSIDHCVESLCSLQSNAEADAVAEKAVQMLIPALLRCRKDDTDLAARFDCQLAVIEATAAIAFKVPMGASHAIGHQLGPLGVGHGETSCICLPAVCKYNAAKGGNLDRQVTLAMKLMGNVEIQALMSGHEVDLGDVLDSVVRALGMPRSLRDVSVVLSRETLDLLARNTVMDKWAKTNPVPLVKESQVIEILEMIV